MKVCIGLVLMLIGIALGCYVGIWLCFIGGIIQIIETIKGDMDSMRIALGILRIFCGGFCGTIAGMIPAVIGMACLESK